MKEALEAIANMKIDDDTDYKAALALCIAIAHIEIARQETSDADR